MSDYLQYHNAEKLGWVPLEPPPFRQTQLAICTRRRTVQSAIGGTVFLIVSLGKPRRYFLWECFRIDQVERQEEDYCAHGAGWQLTPPQELQGPDFQDFRKACAYFVGFRRIDHLPYCQHLRDLAQRQRSAPLDERVERFCNELLAWQPNNGDLFYARGFVRLQRGANSLAKADLDEALRLGSEYTDEIERCRLQAARQGA